MSRNGEWIEKVHLGKNAEILPQLFAYNLTMSALLYKIHANILLEHQKRLHIRGYHIPSDFYVSTFLASYHVNNGFPFADRFNEIIQRVQSAGLYDKWGAELYDEVKHGVFSMNRGDYIAKDEETEIDSMSMPRFIIYGWILGAVLLVLEILTAKIVTMRTPFTR